MRFWERHHSTRLEKIHWDIMMPHKPKKIKFFLFSSFVLLVICINVRITITHTSWCTNIHPVDLNMLHGGLFVLKNVLRHFQPSLIHTKHQATFVVENKLKILPLRLAKLCTGNRHYVYLFILNLITITIQIRGNTWIWTVTYTYVIDNSYVKSLVMCLVLFCFHFPPPALDKDDGLASVVDSLMEDVAWIVVVVNCGTGRGGVNTGQLSLSCQHWRKNKMAKTRWTLEFIFF